MASTEAFLKNRKAFGLVIVCITLLLTALFHHQGWLQRLELISQDWRTTLVRSSTEISDQVKIILIDDAALNAMDDVVGRWPWPRSIHGDVIDFIASGEPRAIVFDVLFSEQQMVSDDDLLFAQSSALSGFTIHSMQVRKELTDEVNIEELSKPLPEQLFEFGFSLTAPNSATPFKSNNLYSLPYDALYQASAMLGVVNFSSDVDGIYRRARLLHQYQQGLFPSLGFAPYVLSNGITSVDYDSGSLQFDEMSVPVDEEGLFLVNHYGKFDTYSMSGVMASLMAVQSGKSDGLLVDPSEFTDKVVFIGASASGLEDLKSLPLDNATPGVYLHASLLSNLLEQDILRPVSGWVTLISTVIFTVLVSILILFSKRFIVELLAPVVIMGGYLAFTVQAFSLNVLFEIAPPFFAVVLSIFFAFGYVAFTEGRDKRLVRNRLAQYVSPAIMDDLMNNYEEYLTAQVGGEENLSILFSDIRGFTSLSEQLPATKVVEILNFYFSTMTDTIFSHKGTIDKFIGDALMAFWGAPIREVEHADEAVQAAITMCEKMVEVNQWLARKQYPKMAIGVGINTGNVILGNIGSRQKLDYTVIGDNVNLASRLEGVTKQYGLDIIISEYTFYALHKPVPCYLVDLVRVKGKEHPISIYSPIFNCSSERAEQLADISKQAFNAYLVQQWDLALILYEQLPDGLFKETFITRVCHYQKVPPPLEWDGVFVMLNK